MAIKTLYKTGAFGPGSDLWVLPELTSSHWAKTIDWYLNYQLSKAKLHKNPSLHETLHLMIEDSDLDLPQPLSLEISPLMVSSSHRLPNDQLVEMPTLNTKEQWVLQVRQIWENLQSPSLRVFLPSEISANEFQKLFPGPTEQLDISLVPDQLGTQ